MGNVLLADTQHGPGQQITKGCRRGIYMNIREAKEEIRNTLRAYHRRDAAGRYLYPQVRQRPILLMGPPGIGKTAIMEQVAAECGVGLVAYTITHHTRQSAIGLPQIVSRSYDGREVSVTEYTLSEIVASVCDCMERTGKREGILFIDEINCVSETLAPVMLQLLQNKTFGNHRIPEGWMIVAAGNPAEYNKSVREFDIVTLDRVRRIDVEADCGVWMEYAYQQSVHGAILSYLAIHGDHFYLVECNADEKHFVTARGWEDLSEILKSYEALGVEVTEKLVIQYLQKREIAREFAAYYRLYVKYGTDYGIDGVLDGKIAPPPNGDETADYTGRGTVVDSAGVRKIAPPPDGDETADYTGHGAIVDITGVRKMDRQCAPQSRQSEYRDKVRMARGGSFEERFTVVGLLLDALSQDFVLFEETYRRVKLLADGLDSLEAALKAQQTMQDAGDYLRERRRKLSVKVSMELISSDAAKLEELALCEMERWNDTLRGEHISDKTEGLRYLHDLLWQEETALEAQAEELQRRLDRAFRFAADCFGPQQEMILLVSGLTRNARAAWFIGEYGCAPYFYYSRQLLCRDEEELRLACREALGGRHDGEGGACR